MNSAPRRYIADEHGHRVLVGLTSHETIEFEALDNRAIGDPDGSSPAPNPQDVAHAAHERRWHELYQKHEEAWREWRQLDRAHRT